MLFKYLINISVMKNFISSLYIFSKMSFKRCGPVRYLSSEDNLKLEDDRMKIKKIGKSIDFSQYKLRHIALKFCYLGWRYSGVIGQCPTDNVVNSKLQEVLFKCQLTEDRYVNITFCGRTDKGVSAFQQVVSLVVRSNLVSGRGIIENSGVNINNRLDINDKEIDYVFILNKFLPEDIKILAWSPVDKDFNARYNCLGRTYKYFLPKGNLSIEMMIEAGQKLVGSHDFRNFCNMPIKRGVTQFMRNIYCFKIEPFDEMEPEHEMKMYGIYISGSSFIYHQIRCIIAVLLMIGAGKEKVEIIDQLLDIDGIGGLGKPSYQMAFELPLVFYEAFYNDIDWQISEKASNIINSNLHSLWLNFYTKETILKFFLNELNQKQSAKIDSALILNDINKDARFANWKPLLERLKEDTLDAKIEKHNIKMKVEIEK